MTLTFISDHLLKSNETRQFPTKLDAVKYATDRYQLTGEQSNNLFWFGDTLTEAGYFELQKQV